MADVLPSFIGMEGLLYLLFSGFVQANKSHWSERFQLIRINPSGGELYEESKERYPEVSN